MARGRRAVLGAMMGAPLAARAAELSAIPLALTMGTGQPGGGFSVYGQAWGQAAQKSARISVSYRASGGSAANVLLVEQNAAQLGLVVLAVANQAWAGRGTWTSGVKLQGFRALFPICGASLQIFAPARSRIRRLRDLAGKVIGVGPAGGAGAVLAPEALAAAGIRPRLAIEGLYGEQIDLLHRGQLDACAFFGITPLPSVREAAARGGFNLIGFAHDEIVAAARALPGIGAAVIGRHTLPHLSAAVATIGSEAIAIGAASLPRSIAGVLTTTAMQHRTDLLRDLPGSGPARLGPGWIDHSSPVPFHPGAAVALRASGLGVPDALIRG
ncbi:MAG TPA: TAXI family TRAP transporter solute-binding subunit [Acidiphilium sp.]|uniref:TAXI family TRAP transporter solute-binding subunit n=1 Tax=unclassified Acidiphilium TaxID=2617493 RepID=UPI000BDD3253|nr:MULTISPECIES: TAXI family TRAP transporter solute-binding subunit [unclassified Acidiphilium]OYV56219.1 MAG: C4-dicarboxylate ABC transporter substrate-binding protein [Acidiphilium sp. 20-67-58]HQT61389.1 TAXI family TRAP transporter solute-binding subunit [Acidiphilium sp.]HQU11865.1 TAXI family TRAP transporter solute-binding subunit [Acidiphilium sp.]